jgi:hypothetical protein
MKPEELEEIKVLAKRKFPGRPLDALTPQEKKALLKDYATQRGSADFMAQAGQEMMSGATRRVGPSGITVNNPYESLFGGLMTGYGLGQRGKLAKEQAKGKAAAADLIEYRNAVDKAKDKEEEEQMWDRLFKMMGSYQ